jgi:hypothetical protein
VDAVVVTCLNDPQGAFDAACDAVGPERVLAPELLHVSRRRAGDGEEAAR